MNRFGTGINNTNGLDLRYAQGNPQRARTTGALTPGTRTYQDGGEMPAGDPMGGGAPMGGEQGGGDMTQQIPQIAQAIIQEMGPEAAMMLAEAIMQMVQGQMGGAPEQAPQGAPAMANGGAMGTQGPNAQMYKKGGAINSDNNLKRMMLNNNYASVEDARSSFREFGINSNVAIVNSQRVQL